MYTPPIQLFIQEENAKMEEMIYTQIKKVGIEVDKEQLLRALRYDRDQYNQGYQDAIQRVNEYIQNPENYRRCVCCPFRDSGKEGYRFSCGRDRCMVKNDWED